MRLDLIWNYIYLFLVWVFKWDWQTIANISVPITLIGSILYWRRENILKFIIQFKSPIYEKDDNGTETQRAGVELTVFNASNDIAFIELLGFAEKYNFVTFVRDKILRFIGKRFYWGQIMNEKFSRKISPFKSHSIMDFFGDELAVDLIRILPGEAHHYKLDLDKYTESIANLALKNERIKKRFSKSKSVKLSIAIKIFHKRIVENGVLLKYSDNPNSIYGEVKKRITELENNK